MNHLMLALERNLTLHMNKFAGFSFRTEICLMFSKILSNKSIEHPDILGVTWSNYYDRLVIHIMLNFDIFNHYNINSTTNVQ